MGRPETDEKREAEGGASRRNFLKLAAAAAPAAVAVAAGAAPAQAAEEKPSALGLRKTEHVQKYLDSCRF